MRVPFALSFVLSLVFIVSANIHAQVARRHHVGRSQHGVLGNETTLAKRMSNARFSYYQTGLGACGKTNSPSDFIVALNSAQYGNGGYCFDMITITCRGKTTQAQITDECPGCPYGGLDFSEGLFEYFASTDAGIIYGDWEPVGDSGGPPETSTSQAPKPTSTSTMSTWKASSTSTSASTSSSSTTTTASTTPTTSTSTAASSSTAAPAITQTATMASPTPLGLIEQLNMIMIGLGNLIVAGAESG